MKTLVAALMLSLVSGIVLAHHSTLGFYDHGNKVVVEGVVTKMSLRNPHVHIGLQVVDESGHTVDWDLETSALSVLRTRGIDLEFIQVGDRIKAAGSGSKRGNPEMYLSNILLADGREVLINIQATPYFTDPDTGQFLDPVFSAEIEERARQEADGIFRVWSTVMGDPDSFPMFKGNYPLNETAAARRDAWDPVAEEMLTCWEKGMPLLMITPIPIEFIRQGDDILIRFGEDDAERLVHMSAEAPGNEQPAPLGYSTGKWEGDTLVVETSGMIAQPFDDRGTSHSQNIRVVERFQVSDSGERLDYTITVTDPDTFTEPFELSRYWVWRPEIIIQDWRCGEDQA